MCIGSLAISMIEPSSSIPCLITRRCCLFISETILIFFFFIIHYFVEKEGLEPSIDCLQSSCIAKLCYNPIYFHCLLSRFTLYNITLRHINIALTNPTATQTCISVNPIYSSVSVPTAMLASSMCPVNSNCGHILLCFAITHLTNNMSSKCRLV